MSGLKWRLEIIDWDKINATGGDIMRNTSVELFFTLADVWAFIGGRLPRQRFGYAGIKNNVEYVLTRWI
jgi:hypothetical protein